MLKLEAGNLKNATGVAHGFFGRQGGVSTGIFASLNCGPGSGDARGTCRREPQARTQESLGAASLISLYQIHSPKAIAVASAWEIGEGPQADAMATNVPGIALGILTADCAPVLLADARAKVRTAQRMPVAERRAQHGVTESVTD